MYYNSTYIVEYLINQTIKLNQLVNRNILQRLGAVYTFQCSNQQISEQIKERRTNQRKIGEPLRLPEIKENQEDFGIFEISWSLNRDFDFYWALIVLNSNLKS